MQQELIDLLSSNDIRNVKLGIILGRTEGYDDTEILRHCSIRPHDSMNCGRIYCNVSYYDGVIPRCIILKKVHRFSERIILYDEPITGFPAHCYVKMYSQFLTLLIEHG
jgi:hypothetical protein